MKTWVSNTYFNGFTLIQVCYITPLLCSYNGKHQHGNVMGSQGERGYELEPGFNLTHSLLNLVSEDLHTRGAFQGFKQASHC